MPRVPTNISQIVHNIYNRIPNVLPYPTIEEANKLLGVKQEYKTSVEFSKDNPAIDIPQSLYHQEEILQEYVNTHFVATASISSLTDPIFTAILAIINNAISRYPRRNPIVLREVSLTLRKDKSPTITWIGNGTFGLRIRTLGANPGKRIITGVILIGFVNTRRTVMTLYNSEQICIVPEDCIIHVIPVYTLCINK